MRLEERDPLVSIIIPCYNHGKYIDQALDSIDKIRHRDRCEVIIVNDGSTDPFTIEKLGRLSGDPAYRVIHQENQGVCVAKNTALEHAKGKYILPVDADNMLRTDFVAEALLAFDNDPAISIVYSDYYLFEGETGVRVAGPYNQQRLMLYNFIENCSMYKKEMTDQVGGYDVFLSRIGVEDWELWLRAAFGGYKFHYIGKPLFDYRVLKGSRQSALLNSKKKANEYTKYFIEKFGTHFGPQYIDSFLLEKFRPSFFGFLYKIILKLYFPKVFRKMVAEGKLREYI